MTEGEREHVAKCLRYIDAARKALAAKGPANDSICNEIEKSTDGIFSVMKRLERLH
jgi:hypothetical protein